jgi:tartrate dehydratase beta subunit/fumarate hydratase class I family protein
VIGKGGMRDKTLAACKAHGAVYLHAIGGAATLIAESCVEILDVYKLDFGVPEAFWKLRVVDFPCVVTMDATRREPARQDPGRVECKTPGDPEPLSTAGPRAAAAVRKLRDDQAERESNRA